MFLQIFFDWRSRERTWINGLAFALRSKCCGRFGGSDSPPDCHSPPPHPPGDEPSSLLVGLITRKHKKRASVLRLPWLARSTEKDITGFFEKSACGKAFSDFFVNPHCPICRGCDTFSFLVRTVKDILIHLKSNFISYLLPLRISQNGIFNISIVVMQKIDRFFAEKVRGINNSCSCKI